MRDTPRISATKLAEYMGASFARKRTILQEQKYPQEIFVAVWSQAESPISEFVARGGTDLAYIDQKIIELSEKNPDTPFKIQNRDLCIEALKAFRLMSNRLPITGFTCSRGQLNRSTPIDICNVLVSVLPQIIIEGVTRGGKKITGGIKFNFVKSHPLNVDSAGYLSTLVHWHCQQYESLKGDAEIRISYAIDIPTSNIFQPPIAYKRRRQQMEEACREIVRQWGNIEPPNGYGE